MRVISNAGPGVKHDIQRALNVRNLNAKTALTQEQVGYIDFAGSYEPEPRLRDMDMQGIDQVMIIPTDIDTYPWLLNAVGAKAFCKAYNQWAYEYTKADPDRLFFAALLADAERAIRGAGGASCRRAGLPRRAGAADRRDGQLSVAAEIRAGVERAGRNRHGLRHAPVPGRRGAEAAGLQRAIFRCRTDPAHHLGLRHPALLPDQCAELPVRGGALGHHGADVRVLRAASETERGGVRGVVDLAQLPARRVRQGVSALSQRTHVAAAEASCRARRSSSIA